MYRNELKYIIDPNTAAVISGKMEKLCVFDENSDKDGFYRVTSLYFDDYSNSALNDNILGQINRKKFRIRIYDGKDDFIRLEKKIKHNQGGKKISATLSLEQYEMIIVKDYEALRESSSHPLIQEFCLEAIRRKLNPKVIVEYDRKSFVYEYGNVRITLDHHVRNSINSVDLFDEEAIYTPAVDRHQVILEVKYSGFLPEHIKNIVQQSASPRQGVSKYTLCRTRRH